MAHRNPGLSRTLPKNFTFPSLATSDPRTPERALTDLDVPPPPPRHSSCRLRRSRVRSGTDLFAQAEYDHDRLNTRFSDIPLPSIEFPTHDIPTTELHPAVPLSNDRFLAPPRERLDMRTPPAQTVTPVNSSGTTPWPAWDYQHWEGAIERPGTACSNASDSSASSLETFASRHSVGGSCTSMESEARDPFMSLEKLQKPVVERPPSPPNSQKVPAKSRWTLEMDNHLWNTYQLYLQDPTITPFKMTPGSIPPLGVTHRVARQARRTWGKRRLGAERRHSPFPTSTRVSRDATPTGKTSSPKPFWPRSETSTRRRLKLLCKRKFSIAPHYQRMMLSRTPTPFREISSRSSREPSQVHASSDSAPYTTRDLGISLVSAAAPGPLSYSAVEEQSRQDSGGNPSYHPVFDSPEHEAQVPVVGSLLNVSDLGIVPRLGSPFKPQTWGPGISARRTPISATGRRETIHIPEPRRPMAARFNPLPNLHDGGSSQDYPGAEENSPMAEDIQHHLEDLFRQGKLNENGKRRVRIRPRGVTTSSVTSGRLDQLFSPPSSLSSMQYEGDTLAKASNPLLDVSSEGAKRLGSPFRVDGFRRTEFPSKLVKHAPSLSDPFVGGMLPQPEVERKGSLPFGPTERHH